MLLERLLDVADELPSLGVVEADDLLDVLILSPRKGTALVFLLEAAVEVADSLEAIHSFLQTLFLRLFLLSYQPQHLQAGSFFVQHLPKVCILGAEHLDGQRPHEQRQLVLDVLLDDGRDGLLQLEKLLAEDVELILG